ncbi:hypothetical protein ACVXHB_05530 [Escherichia coli]
MSFMGSILKAMQPATELGRVELEKYIDALLRYSNEVLTAEERQTALNEALNAGRLRQQLPLAKC